MLRLLCLNWMARAFPLDLLNMNDRVDSRIVPTGTKPTTILFLGFGITPYYRDFLNKLNSVDGISVENIRPSGTNKNLGEGVFEDFTKIEFNDTELVEIAIPPRRLISHPDFEIRPGYKSFLGLQEVIESRSPDFVVVNVVYHPLFCYDRHLLRTIRKIGTKVVFHSIPFSLKSLTDRQAEIPAQPRLRLSRLPWLGRLLRCSALDVLYLRTIRKRALELPLREAQKTFQLADAHAVYHDGGIPIYASYGVPIAKICVVHNSPNTEKLVEAADSRPPLPNRCRILHIGRLVGWKRVDLLIRALAELRKCGFPQTELTVIGYGPCQAELEELARQLKVGDVVRFLGGVYDPDCLAEEASMSSVYALAGMGGLSINEAMCFRLPIVCSRCDGTEKFLVRHGVNGYFFREGDLQDLTAKIAAILSNAEKQRSMGAASRRIIDDELNSEIHVNNYLAMFEKLAQRNLGRYRGSPVQAPHLNGNRTA